MALYAIRRHKAAVNAWCWVVSFRRRGQRHDKRFYDLSLGGSAAAKTTPRATQALSLGRKELSVAKGDELPMVQCLLPVSSLPIVGSVFCAELSVGLRRTEDSRRAQ